MSGMTYQPGFSQAEFADKKKTARREKFLARMEEIVCGRTSSPSSCHST
jgi:hypothetical protein